MIQLVLTLTIHDKDVTMVKPARASFTVRTGLALPSKGHMGAEAYRHDKLLHPTPSKQRLIIAVPSYMPVPSLIKVQVGSSRHFTVASGVR